MYLMAAAQVVTLRLQPSLKKELDKLARSTRRSRSFLAADAIREYLRVNRWQIEHIGQAVAAANRGEFATDQKVEGMFKRLTRQPPHRRAR
jgi:predicted transcriptional regulator